MVVRGLRAGSVLVFTGELAAMAGKDGEVAVGRGCRRPVSDRGVSGKIAGEEKMRC